jgi:glycosyltransferase involved in cell wall biosynthesis
MNNSKKVIIISPYFPYPATCGGYVDILRRIQLLNKRGYRITLMATSKELLNENVIQYMNQYIDHLIIIRRRNAIISCFSLYPLQISSRLDLKNYIFTDNYDYAIIEGDYVAIILKNRTLSVNKKVLRLHNNEAKYFFKLFKSVFPKITSLYYLIESIKFKIHSSFFYKKVDNIACISKDECNYLISHSYHNISFSPTLVESSNCKNRNLESKCVIYVGSLFMPNNVNGLKWYIKNVHKSLKQKEPEYKLIIVGSTHGKKDEDKINRLCKNDSQINCFYNIDDLEPYYDQSSIFINPIFNGAGVKIKSINAVIEGLPLVSTKIGVEGIGFEDNKHILIADDAYNFCNKIMILFNNKALSKSLVNNAQNFLKHNYSDDNMLSTLFPFEEINY